MNRNALRLYVSTLSYLKPRQIYFLVKRRLLPSQARFKVPKEVHLRPGLGLNPCLKPNSRRSGDNNFNFLNVSRTFPVGQVDWACADMPKLWRYNLHYFDYLHDDSRSGSSLARLVSDWIDKNPVGCEEAWEPYTLSLRIVNWIKWFLTGQVDYSVHPEWLKSLYQQATWLESNIEYHLLANHYLKNGKALFFAGVYFSGSDADRWCRKGLAILCAECDEQILPDGGHFERSPMYHCIVVEDYLDVLNLLIENSELIRSTVVERLRVRTIAALDFLNDIVAPDGQIPLFNDSAFGIAPTPNQLFDYAWRVIGYKRESFEAGVSVKSRPDSGYYMIRDNEDMLIVDCGQIGPDYQPGHAHCDTLSYELSHGRRRIVVDSGVYDYEASSERNYARSTRAHNTLVVDGQEQSEIWGVFRVARRAMPLDAHIEKVDKNHVTFRGGHDGYRRLRGDVTHWRTIEHEKGSGWRIVDELQGAGKHSIENFIHLAPGLKVENILERSLTVVEESSDRKVAEVFLPDNLCLTVVEGKYFPEFGVIQACEVIALSGEVALPFKCGYEIRGL